MRETWVPMTAFVNYDLSKQLHYRTLRKHSRKGPWGLWYGSFRFSFKSWLQMLGLKSLHRGLRCQIDIFQKKGIVFGFYRADQAVRIQVWVISSIVFFGRRSCCARLCCELMFDRQTKRCCACHSFSHSQTILLWTRLTPLYVYIVIYIAIYVQTYTCCTDWQIAIGQSLHSPADVRWSAKSVYLFVLLTWSTEIETISLVYFCSVCP